MIDSWSVSCDPPQLLESITEFVTFTASFIEVGWRNVLFLTKFDHFVNMGTKFNKTRNRDARDHLNSASLDFSGWAAWAWCCCCATPTTTTSTSAAAAAASPSPAIWKPWYARAHIFGSKKWNFYHASLSYNAAVSFTPSLFHLKQ